VARPLKHWTRCLVSCPALISVAAFTGGRLISTPSKLLHTSGRRALCALRNTPPTPQFIADYSPAGEEADAEAAFAFWQGCVHSLPGAARDALPAFHTQLSSPYLVTQWLGRQQLAQVVFWGEILSQQKSWEAVGATWQAMHAALGEAAAAGSLPLTQAQVLEVHEGLLRALVLATPPTGEAIHTAQGLVRAVMDGGLAEAIACSSAQEASAGGLHESWGQSSAVARASSVLALPHWVLHESADDFGAVQATQGSGAAAEAAATDTSGVIAGAVLDGAGAAQRAQLYWDPFVWPNPAMESADSVWEESARSEIAPWWAQSTYCVQMWHALHTAAEAGLAQGQQEQDSTEGDFVAMCAGKAQFAEDHVEALVLGWAASGRAEYLSTLLEIASGWLEFAQEFGWVPLLQEEEEEEEEGMDRQLGVAVPSSVLETPAAAARWAGSRLAGRRLLELAEADPGAWAGVLRHFEAMRGIAMEAFDADEAAGVEEGGARGYLDALGQEGALPEGPMPLVPGLPQFAVRVLNTHAVMLPAMRRLREGARIAAAAALEAQVQTSAAQRRMWELQAAEPAKATGVEGAEQGRGTRHRTETAGESRFPSVR